MLIPKARGDLSQALFAALRSFDPVRPGRWSPVLSTTPSDDDDAQIALWTLYELHHRGFDDAVDELEWEPELLEVRRRLERPFERRLRQDHVLDLGTGVDADSFPDALLHAIGQDDGASVAQFVDREAVSDQVQTLLACRSIYHLKESDPVAWTVPRLDGGPKAALVELQYDEYGAGRPEQLHAQLFERGLEACGLRSEYGAYIDDVPHEVLQQNNAMSLFGLHRRLRGAALGHLAAFEATSSLPSRRISRGLARLGFAPEMVAYYDEHVEADAVHEQLAARTICGAFVRENPNEVENVVFGAAVCLGLEDRFARRLMRDWAV